MAIDMSLLTEENNNNRGIPPETSNEFMSYLRDPKYYYPDGGAVILAGNVLFKLHTSLIFGSLNTPGDTLVGNTMFREQLANSDDDNPARLRGFTPEQLRNFLSVVLGLPSDPGYLVLLTGAQDTKKHGRDLLVQYLDIASLSHQFGMTELEKWAQEQLKLVLQSSHDFAYHQWDRDTLGRLHSYAYSSGDSAIRLSVKTFIQYFISISADKDKALSVPVSSNVSTCIELYKDETLRQRDPALFGCIFAAIVSQDHRTGAWISTLMQQDKALLYAAQVHLTSIAKGLQSLQWLLSPVSELPFFTKICLTCQITLGHLWVNTFGKCGSLNSSVLGEDISSLAYLPQHLHALSQSWRNVACTGLPDPSSRSQPPVGIMGIATSAIRNLQALYGIGALIDEVYNELAVKHTNFALEV
ncbi:hypothetical protein OPQ81_008917 [Rhizoctonia solani]|nr:hypothetical protein OPQ81_008917 [Rhizoctonia solani]